MKKILKSILISVIWICGFRFIFVLDISKMMSSFMLRPSWDFLQTLKARREGQDMALVHKFLTDDSGTELFRSLASQERTRTRQAAGEHGLAVQFARMDPRTLFVLC